MPRSYFPVILCLFVFFPRFAEADVPSLSHVFPPGGQRGTSQTFTLHGKFDWPVNIDAPGMDVRCLEESGKVEIAIPSDLPNDRLWIRLFSSEGCSQAVPFLIGSLTELLEKEPNNSPREAQRLDNNSILINGDLKGADADCYLLHAEAGQNLIASVDANTRLGSPIDSILQIALPDGTVVADNHDFLGLDPTAQYLVKESGDYLIRIFGFSSEPNQSIALQGCAECVYRLTITTGPYITSTLPLAISSPTPQIIQARDSAAHAIDELQVQVQGFNLPESNTMPVQTCKPTTSLASDECLSSATFRVPQESEIAYIHSPATGGSTRVRLVPFPASLNLARTSESEPIAIRAPQAVTGLLGELNQIDRYRISLNKGDNLILAVESQTLGMPVDPVVRLLNSEGKKITEVDDSGGTRDCVLNHVATEDGDLVVEVLDKYSSASPQNLYLLTAQLQQPDYELILKSDQLVVPAQGTSELTVLVTRHGNIGPITMEAIGLPEGVALDPAVSAIDGETAKSVTLKFNGSGVAWSGRISIGGKSSEPDSLHRIAVTEPRLGASFRSIWLTTLAAEQVK